MAAIHFCELDRLRFFGRFFVDVVVVDFFNFVRVWIGVFGVNKSGLRFDLGASV